MVVGRGSWVPSRGSWVPSRGSWVPSRGWWVPSRGSWVVGRGSWVIDWKGSALARRRFFGIPSISKQTFKSTTTNNTRFLSVNSRETSSILHTIDQNSEIFITKNN